MPGCGDLKSLPDQFVPPPHIIQQAVNTVNGLAGNGYTTYMLDTEVPQQSAMTASTGNGTPTPTPTP